MKKAVKVVYNNCHGGFGLSDEAIRRISDRKGYEVSWLSFMSAEMRMDKDLVAVVEELGEAANDDFSDLRIKEVTEDFLFDDYDGYETIIPKSHLKFTKINI